MGLSNVAMRIAQEFGSLSSQNNMTYTRSAFPTDLYMRFLLKAGKKGYTKRGQQWDYLEFVFDVLDAHPELEALTRKR